MTKKEALKKLVQHAEERESIMPMEGDEITSDGYSVAELNRIIDAERLLKNQARAKKISEKMRENNKKNDNNEND